MLKGPVSRVVDKAFDPSSFSLALAKEWYHVSRVVDRLTFSGKRWSHVSMVMNEPMISDLMLL